MPPARVVAVAPGSPAARAGLVPGDELVTLNGEDLTDVIRYSVQADEPRLDLVVRRGGLERDYSVDKAAGEPLGLELASAVFDRVRTCDNRCPFCFIQQLPKGMRPSLSVKDDDYRLSFLFGNFTTLTRFTEADLERVVTEALSPLYVSIHATDPEVRIRLLRNRRGGTSLDWLEQLLDAGIEVHGQVVVCPGINDGPVLDDTLLGVLDRFPRLASLGIVPLGISRYATDADLRPHTPGEAAAVLDTVERWQRQYRDSLGRRVAHCSDEYYLMADRPFPLLAQYDGCPQHENGIGMARTFEAEVHAAAAGESVDSTGVRRGFFAWVDGAPAEGYRAPRAAPTGGAGEGPVTLLTGELGARVLAPLAGALADVAGAPVRVRAVRNDFFGGTIAVTGLLTGADVSAALADVPEGERVLVPDVVLSGGRFLDGAASADLPRTVEIVPTDGAALVAALSGRVAPSMVSSQ